MAKVFLTLADVKQILKNAELNLFSDKTISEVIEPNTVAFFKSKLYEEMITCMEIVSSSEEKQNDNNEFSLTSQLIGITKLIGQVNNNIEDLHTKSNVDKIEIISSLCEVITKLDITKVDLEQMSSVIQHNDSTTKQLITK